MLKAGQKVLVLKSPKGVYMQLESGKIVAIKTAIKVKGKADESGDSSSKMTKSPLLPPSIKANPSLSVVPQKRPPNKPFVPGGAKFNVQSIKQNVPNLVSRIRSIQKKIQDGKNKKPISIGTEIAKSLIKDKDESSGHFMSSSDDEHNQNEKQESVDEIQKRISMLKKNISIQRVTSQPKHQQQQQQQVSLQQVPPPLPSHVEDKDEESNPEDSGMDHLEHSTTGDMNDDTPFQVWYL